MIRADRGKDATRVREPTQPGSEATVQLTLTLCLPRDGLTVPIARHVVRNSMEEVGVGEDCIAAIELALSEACTNVLKHSGPGDEYEVVLSIDPPNAVIRVVDRGHGFDFQNLSNESAPPTAERGRGIELMRALVDEVKFTSLPEEGTIVHLEKELVFEENSIIHRLSTARRPGRVSR